MAHGSSDFYAAIDPVVNRDFYGADKNKEKSQAFEFFKVGSDDEPQKSYVEFGGPRQLDQKAENARVAEKQFVQGGIKNWTTSTWAGAATVSMEAAKDITNHYSKLKQQFSSLGNAGRNTPELLCATFMDNAFNSSYPAIWDAKELCSTTHLLPDGLNTFSNMFSPAMALNEEALEQLIVNLRNIPGTDNQRRLLKVKKLMVPSALVPIATKLSRSDKTLGSANNDPSFVKGMDVEPFDLLSSSTRWFAITDEEMGLFWDWIEKLQFITDQVPLNLQKVYVAYFRGRYGCQNARAVYGSNAS